MPNRNDARHPPWLRFRAFGVGLPKTGTTSIAELMHDYRTAHEWRLDDLSVAGVRRAEGPIDDDAFWAVAGPRFDPARLELDVATCHHLYADVLRERVPEARFIVTYRDVRGWVNSLLDLVVQRRRSRGGLPAPDRPWCGSWARWASDGAISFDAACDRDDSDTLPALMRTWASHLRSMAEVLPADRTLWLRTDDITSRANDIAAFLGVPAETLSHEHAHSNRTAVTFDRFTIGDRATIDAVYEAECAELMQEHFPEAHSRFAEREQQSLPSGWSTYIAQVDASLARRFIPGALGA